MFENPRRGRQARNFTRNVPKILDLKSAKIDVGSPCFLVNIIWSERGKLNIQATQACFSSINISTIIVSSILYLFHGKLTQDKITGRMLVNLNGITSEIVKIGELFFLDELNKM